MEYRINKGVGKPVEVSGLQAQYLFIFCGGLIGVFFLTVILFMANVNHWICIGIGITSILTIGKLTFSLNKRYGRWGLMKLQAHRSYPRLILNRCPIRKLFKQN